MRSLSLQLSHALFLTLLVAGAWTSADAVADEAISAASSEPQAGAELPSDARSTVGETAANDSETEEDEMFPDLSSWGIRVKTLGGRQFWGDVLFCSGWRIQHNVITGHYRLLDASDHRCASGTSEQCRTEFDRLKQQGEVPPMGKRAVVFVHGIIRSSKSFSSLQTKLAAEGWTVVGFDYPSTQVCMADSARYLRRYCSRWREWSRSISWSTAWAG